MILQLILGHDEATSLLAGQWALGIMLALVQVTGQTVQFENCGATVGSIIAANAESRQQVAKDAGDRP